MDLSGYDLSGRLISGADFSGARLIGTDFTGADLRRAKFNGADLRTAKMADTMLSRAVLDEETVFDCLKPEKNVTIGINGIHVRRNSKNIGEEIESAAIMTLTPAGNSMKGHSSEVVLENLKHARQLHTASILLVTVVTVILIFPHTPDIKMPVLDLKLSVGYLSIIAQIISLVYQFLVLNHVRDAADGAKYLRTREDAMKIALFPWGISNYPGVKPEIFINFRKRITSLNLRQLRDTFDNWWPWLSNELNRAATSFHSVLFLVGGLRYFSRYWWRYNPPEPILFNKMTLALYLKPVLFIFFSALLGVFSRLVYKESKRFIRPIVFDAEVDKEPQSDLARLAESVEEQLRVTKRLASFIETAIPRYPNLVEQLHDRLPGGVEINMRLIPAGEFDMGANLNEDKKPIHRVIRELWMFD